MKVWLNGEPAQEMPLTDRGLAYGEGFFTTILVKDKTPINWQGHWARLKLSATRLQFPALEESALVHQLQLALAHAPDGLSVIKIILTRGSGGQGYLPPSLSETQLRCVIYLLPFPAANKIQSLGALQEGVQQGVQQELPQELSQELFPGFNKNGLQKNAQAWPEFRLKVMVCEQRIGHQMPILQGLKHLNRLENVLAKQFLLPEYDEALLLDEAGWVISGIQANLVMLKGHTLLTPDLSHCGVQGTLLNALCDGARSWGFDFQVSQLKMADLLEADELFMCNAVRGIMPISQLLEQTFAIEQGQALNQTLLSQLWKIACKK